MEVSFKRHFGQSYMILKGDTEPDEICELSILNYNCIPGFLTVETEVADGETRFWYDITGKHTLMDYLERKLVDFRLLQLLFQGLAGISRQIPAYFLEERNVLLKQEYLYLDFAHNNLEFVYLPGLQQDLRDSFQELMEQLLRRLDHSDKQASAMAYEMYQRSLKREESIFDMLHQAFQAGRGNDTEAEGEEDGQTGMAYPKQAEAERQDYVLAGNGGKENRDCAGTERPFGGKENRSYAGIEITGSGAENRGYAGIEMSGSAQGNREAEHGRIRGREAVKGKKEAVPGRSLESLKEKGGWLQKLGMRGKQETQPPEPLSERPVCAPSGGELPEMHPTEVLNMSHEHQGLLIYQGQGGLKDIRIDKPVVMIGKKEQEVDICIGSKSVSRIHARMEQVEGEYYIEDLNSTNGTFLNGELLEYRQKVKLAPRDRIVFGLEEYIFM